MEQDALAVLREQTVRDVFGWNQPGPNSPGSWLRSVSDKKIEDLPVDRVSRGDILRLIGRLPARHLAICALAWGAMRRDHARLLFNSTAWEQVVEDLAAGRHTRETAYDAFYELRRSGDLPGMGPAYFTKLIYFLLPAEKGQAAIMDQWSACAVNVTTGREIVLCDATYRWEPTAVRPRLNSAFSVSDMNTGRNYDEFCCAVETIGRKLRTGDSVQDWQLDSLGGIEGRLFGKGGLRPSAWRQFVIDRRRAPHLGESPA